MQRIRAIQNLMRSQAMTDGENYRDLLTRLSAALAMTEAAYLVHLQDRCWAMSCGAAYESAERTTRPLVNAHKASLSITQKVS